MAGLVHENRVTIQTTKTDVLECKVVYRILFFLLPLYQVIRAKQETSMKGNSMSGLIKIYETAYKKSCHFSCFANELSSLT